MSDAWLTVLLVGVATIGIKGAGPVALGGRALPPRAMALVSMLAPALLAALVATQVFGGDRELVLDVRVLGMLAAVALIAVRAPVLLVVAGAAAVTALARLL
jgi:branched-subunit amino acid transport protein